MTKKLKKPDTSDELQLLRYKNGIKLIRPEQLKSMKDTGHTVGSLLQLSMSFYLLNTDGITQKMNEEGVMICGFDSIVDSIDKSLYDVSKETSATQLIYNCKEVIQTDVIKMYDEENLRKDGIQQKFLSVKAPWYDDNNAVIGICGFSILLGKHSLAESLDTISKLGLLAAPKTPEHSLQKIKGIQLSKRESECLHYSIKGYTAKRIARELDISHRTVEEYLNNIKIKMGITSKAELIEMAMDYL